MCPTRAALFPAREISLADLARRIDARIAGPADPASPIVSLTTLDKAGGRDVSFLANRKFAETARASHAAAVIAGPDIDLGPERTTLVVADVWSAVISVIDYFCPPDSPRAEIHPSAWVSPEAVLGQNVRIGAQAVIEPGARIGDRTRIGALCYIGRGAVIAEDCLLHPRVAIHDGVEVGRRVIMHSGAVIGADGYKYEVSKGRLAKVPQIGTVVIEDDVEIGANSTIDRASLSETRIGARTKIDNLVHIAHNVIVGSDCLIVAQVGIAGSTRIGRGCVLAGQVCLADNIAVTDGVRIGAKSGVASSIDKPGDYLGVPALPAREEAKILSAMRRLPDALKQIRQAQEEIAALRKIVESENK